eukprot:COSAG03_NODE_2287_length_2918_cov_2.049663_1_plen_75_part_00
MSYCHFEWRGEDQASSSLIARAILYSSSHTAGAARGGRETRDAERPTKQSERERQRERETEAGGDLAPQALRQG